MLTLSRSEACRCLGLAPDRLEKLLETAPAASGAFDHARMRDLLAHLGLAYPRVRATVGLQKGGVGKTLLAVNCAVALARRGARTLLVDLDPEACATNFFLDDETAYDDLGTVLEVFHEENVGFADILRPTRYPGLDLVACKPKSRRVHHAYSLDQTLRRMGEAVRGLDAYEAIFFEVPPTFDNLIASAYLLSDAVVMPVVPDIWSLESIDLTVEDIRESCREHDRPVPAFHLLLNRHAPSRTASRETLEELRQGYGEMLLPFTVRETAQMQNAVNEGKSVFENPASRDLRTTLDRLAETICPLGKASKNAAGTD